MPDVSTTIEHRAGEQQMKMTAQEITGVNSAGTNEGSYNQTEGIRCGVSQSHRRWPSRAALLISGVALLFGLKCSAVELANSSVELESVLVPSPSSGVWRIKKTHSGYGKNFLIRNLSETALVVRSNDHTVVVLDGKESAILPCDTRFAYSELLEGNALVHSIAASCGDVIYLIKQEQ
jgi:hypothetical protein